MLTDKKGLWHNTSINLANVKALMTGEIFHWEETSFTMSWHQPRYLGTNGKYWWSSVSTAAPDWNLSSRTDFYELEWMKDEGSEWSCKPRWLYYMKIFMVRDNVIAQHPHPQSALCSVTAGRTWQSKKYPVKLGEKTRPSSRSELRHLVIYLMRALVWWGQN